MRIETAHEYTTYPRQFDGYRWYKPLLVGVLFIFFDFVIGSISIDMLTKVLFGRFIGYTGYDGMDFYTAPGAFNNAASAAAAIPCLLLAVLIVRDRPFSSYFSSMGGWRWRVFLKTFAAGLLIVGIPVAVSCLREGNTGNIRFTVGGFIILTLLAPFQGVAEELIFRGYIMQTVSSWFRLPVAGFIVQIIVFSAVHPYNVIGVINIAIAALMYGLICVFTKGLEAGSVLHIINNMVSIYMAGFGFGAITTEQTVQDLVSENAVKIVFFLFILFADKKLLWFDEVKCDDVGKYNAKMKNRTNL